jgi:predicted transposase/invertase (TIGR01784 family)
VDDFLDASSPTPNDAYFRAVFADPTRAALFFRSHLEPDLVQMVEWSTLSLQSGSFVDKSLTKSESDLVFTAKRAGQDLVLYLLFEHQSTVDEVTRTLPID